MKSCKLLNSTLSNLVQNESFIKQYKQLVIHEKQKELPIWQPLEIFIQTIVEIDHIIAAAEELVNLEKPTPYLLIDALSIYIKTDSRFDHIRETIPFIENIQH